MEKDWSLLYTTDKIYESEMLKDFLLSKNIKSIAINKQDSSYKSFGEVEIYVSNRDLNDAKKFLKQFQA
ncbi:putative signal transducing protein [Bacteroidota bacterium]